MLSAKNLSCGYTNEIVKLDDFTLKPGEITVLLGPNGCGKSTFLLTLSGYVKAQKGNVLWNEIPVEKLPPKERAKRISLLVQEPGSDFPILVKSVVEMGLFHDLPKTFSLINTELQERLDQAMEIWEVKDLESRPMNELSGGEKQRVHLARIWAQNSDCILLDEPTNHLDIRHQISLLKLLRQSADNGKSVVLTTHLLDFAQEAAQKLGFIANGLIFWPINVANPEDFAKSFSTRMMLNEQSRVVPIWE